MSEVFTGRASEMRKSDWLAAEDIRGCGDVKVTIDKVVRHQNVEFEGGRKKPEVFAFKFVGKHRQLIMKAAIRRILVKQLGNDVTKWSGCVITLYVDETVKMKGETVGGIRIHEEVTKPQPPSKEVK